jgi:hypothetical protein
MLTVGCPGDDRLKTMAEFSRRWDSFNSNLLASLFRQSLAVVQRHKDQTIHAHVAVVSEEPLGGVQYWNREQRRFHRRVGPRCRQIWEILTPERMKGFGLGVANLLPMQGEPENLGRYMARYMSREIGKRQKGDRGARLVRYSQSWDRVVLGPFTWFDARAQRARKRGIELGRLFWGSVDAMEKDFSWSRSASWAPRTKVASAWPRDEAHDLYDPPEPVPIAPSHGSSWKWHLRRTLYCAPDDYSTIKTHAESSLEIYNGPMMAIEAAWAYLDRERKWWEEEHEADLLYWGSLTSCPVAL